MTTLLIALGVACALLMVFVYNQLNKNNELLEEVGLLKGRMEAMKNNTANMERTSLGGPLTVEGIEASVRHAGYVPDKNDNIIRFMVAGDVYYVDASRLPSVFVVKQYKVDPNEWEMDLLKHAAHLMSDELIMVKATFYEDEEGTSLKFFVAALDANNASFQDNLTRYISIIEDGRGEMHETYEKLVKEKRDAALAINPVLPTHKPNDKVSS